MVNKEIFKTFFFGFLIILGCNSIDEISDNPDSNQETDTINNCSSCNIELYQFVINTLGGEIVDEPKIPSALTIKKKDTIFYSGNIGIEIRGESSQYFDKKSYGFETWDENYEDMDVSLLDFPEEEDWILYGPYSDKSLIRNKLIYELSNQMGMYASRTQFIELSINSDYKGLYVFMEKLKRDKNRINISKLKETDLDENSISGGYIIKIDKSDMEDGSYTDYNSFKSNYDVFGNKNGDKLIFFNYEYPKPSDIHSDQKNYIQNYFHEFEDALSDSGYLSDEENHVMRDTVRLDLAEIEEETLFEAYDSVGYAQVKIPVVFTGYPLNENGNPIGEASFEVDGVVSFGRGFYKTLVMDKGFDYVFDLNF